MPAPPTPAEVAYVVSRVAAEVLEAAAGRDEVLRQRAHDWFPDHDSIDWREIGKQLGKGLLAMAEIVRRRESRLLDDGGMVKPR